MPTLSSASDRRTLNLFGLELDLRLTVIVVASTLLLMVDYYHRFLPAETPAAALQAKALERVVYYLVIPLLLIALFRDRPSEYGFTLGDWRQGLKWTVLICLAAVPVLYLAARTPAMAAYYGRVARPLPEILLTSALDLVGWEFLFRGLILFGLLRVVGPSAVLLQAVPFALAHLGKPELETLSTIFGGTLFGWVAWRSRSFVYPFLIHWFINAFTVVAALALTAG